MDQFLSYEEVMCCEYGPRLLGPRLVGPRLVGPRLVGPRLVGPMLVGHRLVGPRLVGPFKQTRVGVGVSNLPLQNPGSIFTKLLTNLLRS